MLKKSSSILAELGLDSQAPARRRLQEAAKTPHLNLQEVPRPLGGPTAAPAGENTPPVAAPKVSKIEVGAKELPKRQPEAEIAAQKDLPKGQPEAEPAAQKVSEVASIPEGRRQALQPRLHPPTLGAPDAGKTPPLMEASIAAQKPSHKLQQELRAAPLQPVHRPEQEPQTVQKPSSGVAHTRLLDNTVPSMGSTASLASMAPELAGLRWPFSFLSEPRGTRVELAEDNSRATRESGIGLGLSFLGPLQLDNADRCAFFEIEVLELEEKRSQTMALGFVTSLPATRPLRAERATDLGSGSILVGYDLPKLYINGEVTSKISGWRPLKDLCRGDRVGLLLRLQDGAPELAVYINGSRKACMPMPGAASLLTSGATSELWGVVDIYGAVRSVRLRRPPIGPLSSNGATVSSSARIAVPPRPIGAETPTPAQGRGKSRSLEDTAEATSRPAKRPRLPVFADCNCTVHLIRHHGGVVHVQNSDFCIGRDTKVVSLALESENAPNMVSRTHARIVSNDGGVHVIDCRSLNGTWLNGEKVAHQLVRSGDSLVIGNPSQAPPDFRFSIALPSS